MSIFEGYTIKENTCRVLRPERVLLRARPVRLRMMADRLQDWRWSARVLELWERLFPESRPRGYVDDNWVSLFRDFLERVELMEWFPIDWGTLNEFHNTAMMTDEGWDYPPLGGGAFECLAAFLWHIPVRCYGVYDSEGNEFELHKGARMIAAMFGDLPWAVEELIEFELWDNPPDFDPSGMLDVNFSTAPVPLRWLPEMIEIIRGRSGYALLDRSPSSTWLDFTPWKWDQDLQFVIDEVKRSAEVVERFEQFMDWLEDETGEIRPDNMEKVMGVILDGKQW